MQWVALVDNLKAFNKYPWGEICYERTLFGLQRALENRVSKYQDKNKKQREKLQLKHIVLLDFHIPFGYVWFPENTKERKKMQRKMIFLCLVVL